MVVKSDLHYSFIDGGPLEDSLPMGGGKGERGRGEDSVNPKGGGRGVRGRGQTVLYLSLSVFCLYLL